MKSRTTHRFRELFAALQKPGKPNWTGAYRPPIPTTYKSRAQLALNLGGLIADGFIAVQAEDAPSVRDIGQRVVSLARGIGVGNSIVPHAKAITEAMVRITNTTPEATFVIFSDVAKENWAQAGELASET